MAKSEAEIKAAMKTHIDNRGGPYSSWYAGIAADAEDRLFNDHGVKKTGDYWVHRTCSNSEQARRVEKYLIELGCDGGGGGGDASTKAVYAYKKSSNTDP